MSAVPDDTTGVTLEEEELPGRPIDPELLELIQRVAHREHLLDGSVPTRVRTTADSSSTRRRPAIGSARPRATRGTTARKVTWS